SAIIDMARRLGIPALTKGVETKEQLDFLKRAGCDLAQGYLFGKPSPQIRK
ncbi:MAG: EAL domain-containing protein, partial [Synergistaceae bacterium]|nr:EAL domain-containing protein [Synergistaceae bacterium]